MHPERVRRRAGCLHWRDLRLTPARDAPGDDAHPGPSTRGLEDVLRRAASRRKHDNLGTFGRVLREARIRFDYHETPQGKALDLPITEYTHLFVLGGNMGAYEDDKHEFLVATRARRFARATAYGPCSSTSRRTRESSAGGFASTRAPSRGRPDAIDAGALRAETTRLLPEYTERSAAFIRGFLGLADAPRPA